MTSLSINILAAGGGVSRVWEFLSAGGVFMLLIAICSVVAVTVTIYKWMVLRPSRVAPVSVIKQLAAVGSFVSQGDMERFHANLAATPSPLSRVGRSAVSGRFASIDEANDAVAAEAREELLKLSFGTNVLEVIITIAPLLGLLGTVSGLVGVFSTLGEAGAEEADPAQLAQGIAMALNTTIAGLVVAVPSVVAHSLFARRIEQLGARMEVVLGRAISDYFRERQRAGRVDLAATPAPGQLPVGRVPEGHVAGGGGAR